MEGNLLYYKGLVGGFKKVYCQINCYDFVAFKGKDVKEILRISLDKAHNEKEGITTEVYPFRKDATQFMLLVQTAKSKKIKYSFKAQTNEEAHLWIKCINQFTENLEENMQIPEPEMDEIIDGQIHEVEHGSSDTRSHPRSQSASASKKKGKMEHLKFQQLYEVFHSKLFVEDNDLNTKIQALSNIQEMFKQEKQALIDLVN